MGLDTGRAQSSGTFEARNAAGGAAEEDISDHHDVESQPGGGGQRAGSTILGGRGQPGMGVGHQLHRRGRGVDVLVRGAGPVLAPADWLIDGSRAWHGVGAEGAADGSAAPPNTPGTGREFGSRGARLFARFPSGPEELGDAPDYDLQGPSLGQPVRRDLLQEGREIFEYIEVFHNRQRLHACPSHLPRVEFEANFGREAAS
jgi:hypothetical protein